MDERVRAYLIEAARQKDKFVYYSEIVDNCVLGLDLGTPGGQERLKQTLVEVSRFENSHGRPMLTSVAINKRDNDHGNGFYDLAEEFGFGKNKMLHNQFWGLKEAERTRAFWQNNENYHKYASLNENTKTGEIEFFNQEELDFFKQWQYKAYDPNDDEHVDAKEYLMDTVWKKSIYLCKRIVRGLEGFQLEGKKVWSQRGWKENEDGNNVQAAIFKPYTWVKVFRNTDRGKDIFFTFGVDAHPDAEAFIYKIDCQSKRDSKLSQAQVDLCKSLIPAEAKWNEIGFEDLIEMDWDSLTTLCLDFIKRHLNQYDAIISAVWGAPIPASLFKNMLIRKDKPQSGFESIPDSKKSFTGAEVDYVAKAKENIDLGDKGEALVKQHEIEFLQQRQMNDKAALVEIVLDGMGFDVLSFDEDGNEKYIEVKTTTGDEYASFYLTENEIDFLRLNYGKYCIYRVYRYDEENNFGEFFEINGDVEGQLLMKPTQYRVLIKKES